MTGKHLEIQVTVSFIGSVRCSQGLKAGQSLFFLFVLKILPDALFLLLFCPFFPFFVESKATSLQELRQKMRFLKVAVQVLETLNGISHGVERNHCWSDARSKCGGVESLVPPTTPSASCSRAIFNK